jgi:aspartate racemase
MKTIGLIGGMSWESSAQYYRLINEGVKQRLGGLHSAKVILYSVDFQEIEKLQYSNAWNEAGEMLARAAQGVEKAGADFVLLCTNTMHRVADMIETTINIPLLHIADSAGESIVKYGFKTVGLLGTIFTMEGDFYKDRLHNKYGLEVLVPSKEERIEINRIIYEELCLGKIELNSRQYYLNSINQLIARGAECIVLGCTEIMMLLNEEDSLIPMFDTTSLHADSAIEMALSGETVQLHVR